RWATPTKNLITKHLLFLAWLVSVCLVQPVFGQVPVTDANKNGVWVRVSAEYTAPSGMGFRQGQSAVLAMARKNAIEKASGFTITSFSLLNTKERNFKWSEDYQQL
ncbi:hypothetical protein RZS08_56735, partial [Arthrospira platensis SPKY1]|nr:hypothetical protein [Arthrospira platensis SPKY1]